MAEIVIDILEVIYEPGSGQIRQDHNYFYRLGKHHNHCFPEYSPVILINTQFYIQAPEHPHADRPDKT